MNTPVDRDAIKRALGDLPFALSEHDEGGGVTLTYLDAQAYTVRYMGRARDKLRLAGFDTFPIRWDRLHIASPDVANAPMLAGRP